MFVNAADHILAQMSIDNSIDDINNSTVKINLNMCNWDDPESGQKYR
jgi:hypothetical protein